MQLSVTTARTTPPDAAGRAHVGMSSDEIDARSQEIEDYIATRKASIRTSTAVWGIGLSAAVAGIGAIAASNSRPIPGQPPAAAHRRHVGA